jgi:predicted acetyltransferase
MLELIRPNISYKKSFLEAVKELERCDGFKYPSDVGITEVTFDKYIADFDDQSRGINLPDGFVPASLFWLVDGNKFIGRVSLRHELNDNLFQFGGHIGYLIRPSERRKGFGKEALRLGLKKAKDLGIDKVLLTCEETNEGSKKIILSNGGVLDNEITFGGSPSKLRYWIQVR